MKFRILIMSLLLFVMQSAYSQTWNEWFRQKKTQKKYLIQQIAALKVYLKYLKKGYGIAKKGMQVVGDIKEGNFNSHKEYFGSLKEVNEVISGSGKVSSTLYFEAAIIDMLKKIRNDADESTALTSEEKQYVHTVCDNLLKLSDEAVSDLQDLLTDSHLEMKDDERITRLAKMNGEARERFSYTRRLFNSNRLLIMQREKERKEVDNGEELINVLGT
jgi:hypothetical protein